MARKSRANSTEALLDVIREDGERQLNFRDGQSPSPPDKPEKKKPARKRKERRERAVGRGGAFFGMARGAVVGVDVGLEHITVVKMALGSPPRLLDIRTVVLESGKGVDDPSFPAKLRQAVGRPRRGSCSIWALYRAADVDIGTIQVPRANGGKLSNLVYWQLQKERKFSDEEFVLDYRVQREVKDGEVPKTEALTCLARRKDVEHLEKSLSAVGYRPTGVTVIPAAFQNIYRTGWAASGDGLTASLHVGATFSCITVYDGADIRFSRTIKFGLDSMAAELAESYNQGQVEGALSRFETGEMDVFAARHALQAKLLDRPLENSAPGAELTAEAVFEAVQDSLERVARQAERTLDYYAQNYHQRCERLHLSGRIFGSRLVADYVSAQLSLEMSVFDPLGGVDLAGLPAFSSLGERMAMTEAVAVALSDSERTLNLAHNYQARQRDVTKTRINNVACVVVMILGFALAGLFIWGKETAKDLRREATSLEARTAQGERLDEAALQRLATEVARHQRMLRAVSERYEGLAVLRELERLTPDKVRLLNLSMELARAEAPEADKAAKGKAAVPAAPPLVRLVVVDAIILGDKNNFETDLTRYLIALKSSELFGDVVVQESGVKDFEPDGEVYHVVLHLQLA